jgi:hypothetical protein
MRFLRHRQKKLHIWQRDVLRSTYGEHSRVVLSIDRERDQPLMTRGGVRGARIESHGFSPRLIPVGFGRRLGELERHPVALSNCQILGAILLP